MRARFKPLLTSFCLLLAAALPALAESRTALVGSVVDSSGAVIPGAEIVIRAQGVERRALTQPDGRFSIDSPPAGPLTLLATFQRFAPSTLEIATTESDVHVVLRPLRMSEYVTVAAPAGRILSATKTDTPVRDIPQAVSVVGQELIAQQGMRSVEDVVRYMPGIGIAQGEGNRDTPVLRGNSSTADLFVDGIRDDAQYFRDLYNVERVEALKGPNAMIFGRGGIGGVINRVVRQAQWASSREVSAAFGAWDQRRVTGDFGQSLSPRAAVRLTSLYEDSGSHRDGVGLQRYGLNPTVALTLGSRTSLRAGYELFHDARTADRGVPSYAGQPVATDPATFFGSADQSRARVDVNNFSAVLEHRLGAGATLRNQSRYANYDKYYQNVFPGAVAASGATVSISAYSNATQRQNFFNQTDLTATGRAFGVQHTLLAGAELGRQTTDNFRATGYFNSLGPAVTAVSVPLSAPSTALPVSFRQSASDADNRSVANLAALYAQDQIVLSQYVHAILGLRYDRFQVDLHNNRTATDFESRDGFLSPRLGLVVKPIVPLSLYASYSRSFQPRAGEQLSSLSASNQALDPEEFKNYEVGAKWDIGPELAFSVATYRLDRTNVAVPDPADPTRSVLVDGQRSKGLELGLSGKLSSAWSIVGGYALQEGEITRSLSATAQAGARLAQLPRHSFSLWNKYDVSRRLGLGLGVIHRGSIFTSTDNTVSLPAFTRVDAGLFLGLGAHLRAQANVENLFDREYYASAHSNNNITPGSPRALRVVLTTAF